ncbi:glycine receptor subunit alpha-2-like [Porites lutea]|uniref:glycine receptor subunit alpha-2-like n=1 Tax=Porites lutea TaxID=51062 RepID=UPI003CC61BE3
MKAAPGENLTKLTVFIVIVLVLPGLISGNSDVITAFFEGYDKAVRPGFENGTPVTIRSSIYVESFGNIEEANMEYKVYSYFRQLWRDSRLAGKLNSTFTITGGDIDNMWVPDPFCYNARESNLMLPNEEVHSLVHIQPNGDVLMSKGMTVLASCDMNLQDFPLDSQTCNLKIGSYAYSTRDIVYEWIPGEVLIGNKEMAQFYYEGSKLSSYIDVYSTGNFSTITVTFSFQRRIGYYLIQIYFPTIFVVMLSWIVFFMEKDDVGNRMALGITTILTIMFLLGSLNGNLPKVSYPKALDWYLLVGFSFVFLSLIECMIVYILTVKATEKGSNVKFENYRNSRWERVHSWLKLAIASTSAKTWTDSKHPGNGSANLQCQDDLEMVQNATNSNNTVLEDGSRDADSVQIKTMATVATAIENIARILFPLAFIGYNIFYWTYY